jgi:hypothetical protein
MQCYTRTNGHEAHAALIPPGIKAAFLFFAEGGGVMFKKEYEMWMQKQVEQEKNHRRREFLQKGLSHGTVEFLRLIWFPAIGNFDYLFPEWEVRDYNRGYRYLDLAFLPEGVKGDIEIHYYRTHARDLDTRRFKDLCNRQSLLSLDDWVCLTVAYLSIQEEPEYCKQLVFSFVGKFLSIDVDSRLNFMEAETVRFARRLMRPFTPMELARHLRVTDRYARVVLHGLVEGQHLIVVGGKERFRSYQLNVGSQLRVPGVPGEPGKAGITVKAGEQMMAGKGGNAGSSATRKGK